MPLEITPAAPADYDWCARLMTSSDPWLTLGRTLPDCLAVLHRPGAELYLARQENSPAGFVLLAPYGFAGSPYLAAIAVAPAARGQNIGSELLAFAERLYTPRGHLFLLVSSFNHRAQALYRRRGYQSAGEIKDYLAPGTSELILHKKLS